MLAASRANGETAADESRTNVSVAAMVPPGVKIAFSPLETRLLEAAARGDVDRGWLLSAVLAAGGEEREAFVAGYVRRVKDWSAALRDKLADQRDTQPRTATILEYLHDEILRADYQADATELAGALDGRGFNCVSSAVLFNYLAEDCGLKVAAVEVPGHVFSVVESESGEFDVETTCRNWFHSPEPAASQRRHGPRRRLSASGLAALVYYNRGVDLLAQRRFAEAIAANLKALRFDPTNEAARSNWLAGVNNWALDLHERQEFSRSVNLLRHGLRVAPEHRPFRINFVAVHQRWIETLVERGQYEPALEALRRAREELPQESYFESAAAEIRLQRMRAEASPNPAADRAWSVLLHQRELQAAGGR